MHRPPLPTDALIIFGTMVVLLMACAGPPQPTSPTDCTPALIDWTVESGIDFVHFNGMTGDLYYCEMMGPGVGLFDADNDGDLDLYVTQGGMLGPGETLDDAIAPPEPGAALSDRLFRNELISDGPFAGRLVFTDVTESAGITAEGYGMGVIAGDIDNDGFTDLYVTNFGPNQLLRNRGDGTFEDITAASGTDDERWSVSAAFVDYDRDGWLDLYVSNYTDFRFENRSPCFGTSGEIDYCGPMSHTPEPDRLFHNRGGGVFVDVTEEAGVLAPGPGLGVVTSDFDGDGWVDIYVANDQAQNFLWMNQRDGTFENEAMVRGCALDCEGKAQASMGVVAGDVDGDGDDDLFMTHLLNEVNTLYINDGDGLFLDESAASGLATPSMGLTGFGTAMLDLDNNGWLDLVVANGAVRLIAEQKAVGELLPLRQPNSLLTNDGGRFRDATERAPSLKTSLVSRGAAAGDLDNDGDTDVVITNNNGPLQILVNACGHQAGWIGLDLVAADGHHLLGAQATVVTDDGQSMSRRSRTDSSYLSSNDPRILVGLGTRTSVKHIDVHWPDGMRERFANLATNQYHVVTRGSGFPTENDAATPGTMARAAERTDAPDVSRTRPNAPATDLTRIPPISRLGDVDPLVRRQIETLHRRVQDLLRDSDTSSETLADALGALGQAYHAYQILDAAQTCYGLATRANPSGFQWHYLLAHALHAEGRITESNASFDRALAIEPASSPALVWRAENHIDLQRFDAAERGFRSALAVAPDTAKAHLGLARVALATHRPEDAVESLERAFLLQPEAYQIHYTLGLAYRALGDLDSAQAFFDMVPKPTLARVSITLDDPLMQETADLRISTQFVARMGNKALSQGRFTAAIRYLELAVQADPDRIDTRYNLAAALARMGDSHAALQHLEVILDTHSEYALAHVLAARLMIQADDHVEASRRLARALEIDPRLVGAHVALGELANLARDHRAAIDHFRQAHRLEPGNPEAIVGIALAHLMLGNHATALSDLEPLAAGASPDPHARLLIARLLAASSNPGVRDSSRALEIARRLDRERRSIDSAETLAMALAATGAFPEAIRIQRKVLETTPDDSDAYHRASSRLQLYLSTAPCLEPWTPGEKFAARPIRSSR